MKSASDRQTSRSDATQTALKLAAEKLIADKGIENVSIREIVKDAGQKNESALQYHFKNLQGLFRSIRQSREAEIHIKREALLDELMAEGCEPTVRDLCRIMASPIFLLARKTPEFRRYVLGFSLKLALTSESALTLASRSGGGGESGQRTGELLRAALPHFDETAYRRRMESVVRLCAISMGYHARQRHAFRGASSELFLSSLIDEMVGLLSTPVSADTKTIAKSIKSSRK